MSDLLSAASLLLTALSVIFGLWQPSIEAATVLEVKPHAIDNKSNYGHAMSVLWGKAIPLAVVATTFTFVFLPDCVTLVKTSVGIILSPACCAYDSIQLAFILIECIICLLAGYLIWRTIRLTIHLRKLSPEKDQ